METPSKERLIILALQAFKNDPKLNVRKAVKIYKVSHMTLTRRQKEQPSQAEITVKSQKLSNLKEEIC